ncbi:MAG: RluA family pseudouridine synthase [Holosporales bacterium]|jgi:23S rRNA pseudouridine1911/1915/1917 synthase|nr:RluA family pseudouridine synthase [Holosporales bacterium]
MDKIYTEGEIFSHLGELYIGKRIDIAISEKLGISRSHIQKLIKNGDVSIDNQKIFDCSMRIQKISDIFIKQTNRGESTLTPENIPLDILYEDEHVIVLNKSVGMVCHPAPGNYSGTLVHALLYHSSYHNASSIKDVGNSDRPGLVHRLDKDTSGLMIIAKDNESHKILSEYFLNEKGNLITRRYKCFTFGAPNPPSGTIETMITRDPKNRQRYIANPTIGKKSVTMYTLLRKKYITSTKVISLIECQLLTGRTHQIRVHMKHQGTNIVGDQVYGKRSIEHIYPDVIKNFPRPALHSYFLMFLHPITNKFLTFEIDLPNDMKEIEKLLDTLP